MATALTNKATAIYIFETARVKLPHSKLIIRIAFIKLEILLTDIQIILTILLFLFIK